MKISEARSLLAIISQLQATELVRKPRFAYFLSKNKRVLDTVEKDFQDAVKDDAGQAIIQAFETDRLDLINKLAEKDENGNPVVANGVFKFADEAAAMAQIQALIDEKHPTALATIEAHNRKVQELSEKDDEIAVSTLPVAEWPELPQSVDPSVMDTLYLLMRD